MGEPPTYEDDWLRMPHRSSTSHLPAPSWLDSVLFVTLMSGPPKFRARDLSASLSGEMDSVVLVQIAVWACGALWVAARLYPSLVRRGAVPPMNAAQVIGALLIGFLSLSMLQSPGVLLTAFVLGQFAVMLSFAWVFAYRFGPAAYLRHLFAGVCVLMLLVVWAAIFAPELVFVGDSYRMRGDYIAGAGAVAVIGLILCLSNTPVLSSRVFWATVVLFGLVLAASQTRTAYLAFLVYLAIGYVYGRGLPVRKLMSLLVVLLLAVFVLDAFSRTTAYVVREEGSVETMSDRLPLWGYLTDAVMREAPLTGLGYYAASRVLAPRYNAALGNAHSALFEILVGGGFVAAALYVLLCIVLLAFAVRLLPIATGNPEVVAACGLLMVTIVLSVTASEGLHAGPIGFTFWSLTALVPSLGRQSLTETTMPRATGRRPSAMDVHVVGRSA
jgi:O-antigen ligase